MVTEAPGHGPESLGEQDQQLSPRQVVSRTIDDVLHSPSPGGSRLDMESFDMRADPDAQATVTDFLDFTEYLPADMTRSLTLIGELDEKYINASSNLFGLTKKWGELPGMSAEERPFPAQLRADISECLNHAISSRTYSHAEAVRMQENTTRHYLRAKTILAKLQTMLENYPTAEEQAKSSMTTNKTQTNRVPQISLRVGDGRKGRGRPIPRITVPGEVLPPYDLDYAACNSSDSSSESEAEEEEEPAGATPAPQPRIKIVKTPKQPKTPKPPKAPKDSKTPGTTRPVPPVPAIPKELLKPPPEGAVIGSADLPWLQLTPWELARLRKRMKKNAQWHPSDTMIARELKMLERGPEAYQKAKQLAEEQGKPFEPAVPTLVADANGVEHAPMGALSLDAALAAEDRQGNNRGLKLNVAKKLKRENLARLAAEEAEESARRMAETVNALLHPNAQQAQGRENAPEKPAAETPNNKTMRKYGGRKRKRDSATEADADKSNTVAEPPSATTKRTKMETPVPLPQQSSGVSQNGQPSSAQTITASSQTPVPPSQPAKEKQSVTPSAKPSPPDISQPTNTAGTTTTTVPVKPPAELSVPPPSPKKSTTPILPPVRETRKSQAAKKEAATAASTQQTTVPKPPASRSSTPGPVTSSRPTSRGKAASQEPPTLASDRTRRQSTARNTPAPVPEPQRQPGKRIKRPAPGVVSRTNSGGSSAVGRRKAAPKVTKAASKLKKERGQQMETDVEVEVDDEGNVIDPDEPRYCLCNGVSFGTMIACENENCQYEWFHLECVKLEATPARTTKWYCPSCRVLLNIGEKGEVSARGVKM
ncbi:hypothetical protein MGG_10164 [Pyricularia oryzae 70-15]|uniref:PHD-type domain-containing protein n=3 Tax=Pyricularia oryzae TaxID=318829 RepID=G4MUM3_PYRO7|nr:uncharacterized protein MGG_10164 [Pyricularia oryzae 70-15]EHA53996.1 hypothetical protein MGG_10164 [Pyricularia oryzae 70-15]ELQ44452.1 hypothetical protein OOU_Y34scaffold00087g30 [Pyricularia oryzae Y34]